MEPIDKTEIRNRAAKILHTLKPITIFENLYGIFKFNLVNGVLRPPNWKLKTVAVIYMSIFCYLYVVKHYSDQFVESTTKWSREYIMKQVPAWFVLIQYVVSCLKATFPDKSKSDIHIIKTFAELDCLLHFETLNRFYAKSRSRTNILVLFLLIYHLLNFVLDIFSDYDYPRVFLEAHIYLVQKLQIVGFFRLMSMVTQRLDIINGCLNKFILEQERANTTVFSITERQKRMKDKFNFIGHPSESNVQIRNLALMYNIIGKQCCMINELHNFKFFMILLAAFGYVVVTIWTALSYYQTQQFNATGIVIIAIWCLSTICNLTAMAWACEALRRERRKTKISVNMIVMDYSLPKTMRVQAKAFMELIEAWPLRICIYDIFSIDITLLLKFISVSTTYLIVLIQIYHLI
ncbi:uncharacterized protein LOC135117155 [Helicoverpa armigera]|uniref:uncharacterized protein LOC135117155 n=1 Tax=Helicoverpa armigera TaxID=29058 RepID=UPI003083CE7A